MKKWRQKETLGVWVKTLGNGALILLSGERVGWVYGVLKKKGSQWRGKWGLGAKVFSKRRKNPEF